MLSKQQPKLQLYYFDIKGKGEPLRLLMNHAGLVFEDIRISKETFLQKKESGEFPFGQVPCLIVDEKHVLVQTNSIARFIGKLSGLYPSDPVEASMVDAVMDQEADITMGLTCTRYAERNGFAAIGSAEDPVYAAIKKSLNDEVLPRHLGNLEKILKKSPSGWIGGTPEASIADFVMAPRLEWIPSNFGIDPDILAKFPAVSAFIDKFNDLDSVKKYYSEKIIN
uniref:Glutathione S-transferase n=1 Tax=Chromera velia CCMP2878 TaxID=1169474 RepID=A0A0G4G871_9ALVE|mmetsp:Transcript_24559/g.48191  ORF Transcript_24559/g.48191 Transcript_24559/m.48191 type:complete len:224 (-) Transcript_24559:177-848(-)|eukprot:Cvel_20652.t1-p1 / transcript=Cvel_20652.t1 / gene=Cvel_20652 / organism=Chromera_velia_CCMP2878 / gene_product=Glutathione S-transferase 1, putative / transcript_product=Glutathione S-transferase 1, putative / location=Cvel_scaffold1874:5891-7674(+) / protein_length=223 / sequence_SO=supercontig / SO=protein_coding / is_pseudo=false